MAGERVPYLTLDWRGSSVMVVPESRVAMSRSAQSHARWLRESLETSSRATSEKVRNFAALGQDDDLEVAVQRVAQALARGELLAIRLEEPSRRLGRTANHGPRRPPAAAGPTAA